jgi:hypothetical protein
MISSVRGSVLALVAVGFSWALGAPAQQGVLVCRAPPTGSTRRQRSVARNSRLPITSSSTRRKRDSVPSP